MIIENIIPELSVENRASSYVTSDKEFFGSLEGGNSSPDSPSKNIGMSTLGNNSIPKVGNNISGGGT
jgi:hypothetical protein